MLRCLSCFPCSRAYAEAEEANHKALQELQQIGNLRHPSCPSQALSGSVTQANTSSTADQGEITSADAQQEGQQHKQHLQASFGRRVKSCHDDFEVNRLVRYLKEGSWAMRAMAAEELWKEAAVRPLAQVLAQHQVAPALVTILRDGTELGKMYAAYTLLVLLKDPSSVDKVVDEGAVQALQQIVASSHLPTARMAALRGLARLARHRRAAAVLMALEGHKVLRDLLRDQDHHSSLVKGALVTLYYLGADKNHIQDALGRAELIPRLLELCVCDNTCVAHQAAQVLKVLCKSVLCCNALQVAGAGDILKSILAEATEAGKSTGNTGKEGLANGGSSVISSSSNENSSMRHLAPEGGNPAQIALERLELVLRTQQNIPSTRPKNHMQPYEVDGPAQQQLLFGTPTTPCTPLPLSPTGTDGDLDGKDTPLPARGNGQDISEGPQEAVFLNGSSGSGSGKVSALTKGTLQQKPRKKRVAWAGVPDQLAPESAAEVDKHPAQDQQLLWQQSTPETLQHQQHQQHQQPVPESKAALDQQPASNQRLLWQQSTPETLQHQQQQQQHPAPELKAALDQQPALNQQLLQQQLSPEELQHQRQQQQLLVQSHADLEKPDKEYEPCTDPAQVSAPNAVQPPAFDFVSIGPQCEGAAAAAQAHIAVSSSETTQPTELDFSTGKAQHAQHSAVAPAPAAAAAAQAFIAVSGPAIRGRTSEQQQHKNACDQASVAQDESSAGVDVSIKEWLGAREQLDSNGGTGGHWPAAGGVLQNGTKEGAGICAQDGTKQPDNLPQEQVCSSFKHWIGAKEGAVICTGSKQQVDNLQQEQLQSISRQQQQQQHVLATHDSRSPDVQPTHQHEPQKAARPAASEAEAPTVDISAAAAAGTAAGAARGEGDAVRAAAGAVGAASEGAATAASAPSQSHQPERPSPKQGPTESAPLLTSPDSHVFVAQSPLAPPILPASFPQFPLHSHHRNSPLSARPGHARLLASPSTSHPSGASSELFDGMSTPILPMPPLRPTSAGVSPRSQPALGTSFFSSADVLGAVAGVAAETEHGSASDSPDARANAIIHRRGRPGLWSGYPRPRKKGSSTPGSMDPKQMAQGDAAKALSAGNALPEGTEHIGGADAATGSFRLGKGSASAKGKARRVMDMGIGAGRHGGAGHASAGGDASAAGRASAARGTLVPAAAGSEAAPARQPASAPMPTLSSRAESGSHCGGEDTALHGAAQEDTALHGAAQEDTALHGAAQEDTALHGAAQLPSLSPLRLQVPVSRSMSSRRSSSSSSSSSSYVSSCANTGEVSLRATPRDSPTALWPHLSVGSPASRTNHSHGLSPLGREASATISRPSGETSGVVSSGTSTGGAGEATREGADESPTAAANGKPVGSLDAWTTNSLPHALQPQQSLPQKRSPPRKPIRLPAASLSASAPPSRLSVKAAVAAIEQRQPYPSLQHQHRQAAPSNASPPDQHTQQNIRRSPRSPMRRASMGSFKATDARCISARHSDHRLSQDSRQRKVKTDTHLNHHPIRQSLPRHHELYTAARPLSSSLCRMVPRQSFDSLPPRRTSGPPTIEGFASSRSPSSSANPPTASPGNKHATTPQGNRSDAFLG